MRAMVETAASIHAFWFGENFAGRNDADVAERQAGLWWGKDTQVDATMRGRFLSSLVMATGGKLDTWSDTTQGLLSLVLLTDQFARNIHRGTPQAFATDSMARRLAHLALRRDLLPRLRPVEQVFLLLPLEHSEDLADQRLSVEHFEALAREVHAPWRARFEDFADYARRHRDVIARFGRFPHRNAILRRASTEQEIEFLKQPGSSF
jgi:uncharacterized protein (DUF924 family)